MRSLALLLCFAASAAAEERYLQPVIFQRVETEPGTKKVVHNGHLWLMEADGSKLKQLTFGPAYDEHPSLYSDLEHVLYAEFSEGFLSEGRNGRLVKLNVYTGQKTTIDEAAGCALHHATLSPVRDLAAYHYDCGERRSQAMDFGKNRWETEIQATNGVRTSDGIVAMHTKKAADGAREVSLVHIRGRGMKTTASMLAIGKLLHRRPAIAPDEKLLAWQTNAPDGGEDEIYLANIDGSNARNITKSKGNDGHPWFSRDGKFLVFESDRSGRWEIWRYDLATGKQTQLTDGKGRYDSTRARM